MPPTFHLVRHAQGFHNLSVENESIPDPLLTELGKQQCANLRAIFPYHAEITHFVASPMRRTIFTCLYSFAPSATDAAQNPLKVLVVPEIQEISTAPCDIGSDVEALKGEFGELVDWRLLDKPTAVPWNDKTARTPWQPTIEKLQARAQKARVMLRELVEGEEDSHVVVVTHGGFLHFLTADYSGIAPGRATGWENTDCRSYQFADPTGEDPAALLVETEESRARRKAKAVPPTATEQRELQSVYYETWASHWAK